MKNQWIEKACKETLIFCRQHKSTILSCISAAGVVATGVLSARGGIKAERILSEMNAVRYGNDPNRDDYTGETYQLPKWKKVVRLVPALLPPVLTAAGTIALIFVTDAQNRQTQAALAGAYAVLAKKLSEYKAEVKELFGEDADKRIEESIARKKLADNDILAEERAENAKLWYDNFSERYFWATDAEVSDAEYYANRIFALRGYLTLNDFYNLLPYALEPVACGDEIGWDQYVGETCYGYIWIDFAHIDHPAEHGEEAYTELCFPFPPHPFYEEEIEMEKEYERFCAGVRKEAAND